MEKPSLEKVIQRLKEADIYGWEITGGDFNEECFYRRPAFRLKLNGVMFNINPCVKSSELFFDKYYYFLSVQNWEKNLKITYNDRKNNAEQELLKNLYEKLFIVLKKREEEKLVKQQEEFEKALDEILSN